jgi:hypothetical protein
MNFDFRFGSRLNEKFDINLENSIASPRICIARAT